MVEGVTYRALLTCCAGMLRTVSVWQPVSHPPHPRTHRVLRSTSWSCPPSDDWFLESHVVTNLGLQVYNITGGALSACGNATTGTDASKSACLGGRGRRHTAKGGWSGMYTHARVIWLRSKDVGLL